MSDRKKGGRETRMEERKPRQGGVHSNIRMLLSVRTVHEMEENRLRKNNGTYNKPSFCPPVLFRMLNADFPHQTGVQGHRYKELGYVAH